MPAHVVAHVLDDAQDGDVDLAEHRQAFARVDQRDVLRRRHHHRAGQRHFLRQRELRVAGARREIDDHEVQRSPFHVGEELIERFHHHRSAPDHRRIGIGDQTERHRLDAVILHRDDFFIVLVDLRTPFDAEHHLLRRSINVGIEQADGVAQ